MAQKRKRIAPSPRSAPANVPPRVDRRDEFGAPFAIYTEEEGNLYARYKRGKFLKPHPLDWDLVESLGLTGDVKHYLKFLGLEKFSEMSLMYSEVLGLEFLCTFKLHNGKHITCRLMSREFTFDKNDMKNAFGFPETELQTMPQGYDKERAWFDLTGCENWGETGGQSTYIIDPALSLVHRFYAYNVSGKKEGNKVSSSELFSLHAVKEERSSSPTWHVWYQLDYLTRRSTNIPSFFHIATRLAIYKELLDPNVEAPIALLVHPRPRAIDLKELTGAGFARDKRRVIPHEERPKVKAYQLELDCRDGFGPSTRRLPIPHIEPYVEPADVHGGAQRRMHPDDLAEIRGHIHSSYSDFRRDMFSHFEESEKCLRAHLDSEISTLRQSIFDQLEVFELRREAHDKSRYDEWIAAHFPPPPNP